MLGDPRLGKSHLLKTDPCGMKFLESGQTKSRVKETERENEGARTGELLAKLADRASP